jgi:hypothetical protein
MDLTNQIENSDLSLSSLQSHICELIQTVDDPELLKKVASTLEEKAVESKIAEILSKDADASKFVKSITDIVVQTPGSLEEKMQFLQSCYHGIVDITRLLSGEQHTFDDVVGSGFNNRILTNLSTGLAMQGVGPGELALTILSPHIRWSGRNSSSSDLNVSGKNVELKTSVSDSGGRWINTRKAKMDIPAINRAIINAVEKSDSSFVKHEFSLPERVGISNWVNNIRSRIKSEYLTEVTTEIANGLFRFVDTNAYQVALASGSEAEIRREHMNTGFLNYKAYAGFDGILIMDIPRNVFQYFEEYAQAEPYICVNTPYISCPETEVMPKVRLLVKKPDTQNT